MATDPEATAAVACGSSTASICLPTVLGDDGGDALATRLVDSVRISLPI
jgi:hypothetical protein